MGKEVADRKKHACQVRAWANAGTDKGDRRLGNENKNILTDLAAARASS